MLKGAKLALLGIFWQLLTRAYVCSSFQEEWWLLNRSNVTTPIRNITTVSGRDAVFNCVVNSTDRYKTNKVAWVRAEDQTILSIGTKVVTHNNRIFVSQEDPYTWQLRIKQVKVSDRGCYLCEVNTSAMRTQEACLDVKVPPDILNNDTSGDISTLEGENATLWCKASGHPPPRVLWKQEDGHPIFIRRSLHNFTKADNFRGSNLAFWKVDRIQMGSYLCIASNDVPPAVSKRVSLYVNFPPTIKVPNQLLGAPVQTDVQLECYVEAFPNTINYWVKNRSDMLLNGSKYLVRENRIGYRVYMSLLIKSFSAKDVGTYNCVSTNSLGKAEGTLRLYEIKLNPVNSFNNRAELVEGVAEPARGARSKEVVISSAASLIDLSSLFHLILLAFLLKLRGRAETELICRLNLHIDQELPAETATFSAEGVFIYRTY
ncbi:hypothetical protein HUJ05_011508 [Dendroctonus ponderosae]|nr:hypothetical protein HUJ05_011508 [Dendroctonus ponderosae]KAH1012334.1 hypothetical protein HUJ05_011508 [Dendroctonus ponderosae]